MKKLFVLSVSIFAVCLMTNAQEIQKVDQTVKSKEPVKVTTPQVVKAEKVITSEKLENKKVKTAPKANVEPAQRTNQPATVVDLQGNYERGAIVISKTKKAAPAEVKPSGESKE